ncbi:MAG: hypothetical protein V7765_09260 [Oleispira sp.]|jgi:hypothetical protein
MGNLSRLIMQGSAVLLMMVLLGCAKPEEEPNLSAPSNEPIPDVEPILDSELDSLPKVASTFDELVIEDGFTFAMQRIVNVGISFSQKQAFTEISIFTAIDPDTNTPINLLEKAELTNTLKFSTALPVPSYTESLVVVINGDRYAELELPIEHSNRIHYLVE